MAWIKEVAATIRADIGAALGQPRHVLLIMFGFLVAGTTVALLLTIPAGVQHMAGVTGSTETAMVLANGASTESSATFGAPEAALLGTLPGVAHTANGRALVAPQFVANTRLVRSDGSTATVLVRGVTPLFWKVAGKSVGMTSGIRFQTDRNQLIAGLAAARGFVALNTGDVIRIHNQLWRVTGHFSAGGGFWESQLWTGMAALQAAYHAQGRVSVAWVRLDSPAAFKQFSAALHDDPRTRGLHAQLQRTYYGYQTAWLRSFIQVATVATSVALGLGAVFAIVNALAMALDARRHDFAVLRAVGFRRGAIAAAILLEVLAVAVVCAGIAVLISWFAVDGREVGSSTISNAIQFKLRVDGNVVGWTLVYLVTLALVSTIWPVVRGVCAPLTQSLHDQ